MERTQTECPGPTWAFSLQKPRSFLGWAALPPHQAYHPPQGHPNGRPPTHKARYLCLLYMLSHQLASHPCEPMCQSSVSKFLPVSLPAFVTCVPQHTTSKLSLMQIIASVLPQFRESGASPKFAPGQWNCDPTKWRPSFSPSGATQLKFSCNHIEPHSIPSSSIQHFTPTSPQNFIQ